ncbi:N-6 DNA methylase [Rhodococcus zopfii]|uniref:site-specific DNA-methyltransferase (adenine-specific) n=1 Tax=Rhodococcus zopfii TaxID=43772 RepID=A0ABU3WK53_9NOCA|nr:N-6 DNA methylase [Rhodococcus zopfii]
MTTFADLVAEYGATAKSKLSGPGEREALLSAPVATFVERVGALAGHLVVAHNEVMELDGTVRPDFGVRVNGVLTGHIELKAPGVSLDPSTYRKTSHNFRQWQRLKELPNLLHTNGTEWRLWRFGELVDNPVHIHSDDLRKTRGSLTAPSRLELIINSFLAWSPSPIVSVGKLVETLAPLARMLREEVLEALRAEKAAVKSGADKDLQPFTGMAKDWRAMLFPQAKNDEFADGFAQTVVFALVLAVSEGIDIGSADLHQIAQRLESHHTLMGRALNLLTAHIKDTPTGTAVEMISRTLSGAIWERISGSGDDIYLHLYEHFLGVYDPERRRGSGSYYTPVEVVDAMVRLTDEALKLYFNRPQGLRNPNVAIVDPAMGTGTYPLSVLRQVATSAAQQYGPAAASEAVASAVERLYGLELQSGPFSVAELRITSALRDLGAELPETGLNLFVADTLEDPESGSRTQLSYTLQLIAQQRRRANAMKRDVNVQVVIGNPPYRERAGGDGGLARKWYGS